MPARTHSYHHLCTPLSVPLPRGCSSYPPMDAPAFALVCARVHSCVLMLMWVGLGLGRTRLCSRVLACASCLGEVGAGGGVCGLVLVWAGLGLGLVVLVCAHVCSCVGPIWVRLVQGGVWLKEVAKHDHGCGFGSGSQIGT
ncbi:hypothetical protein PILCRDRAFT_11342 [Piloderma croceum F 1598]|uniref:Uncharacterized protein n=1 Tax=Piloderma croceum (strain F 1598) TaxID=765440 RepID=A0A0C3BM19_PILCF|nr:hypothetical protein PILCRDRAFT_11342 [Piloderma croceum F 1598]